MRAVSAVVLVMVAMLGCTDKRKESEHATVKNVQMVQHCVGRTIISMPDAYVLADGSTGSFKLAGQAEQDAEISVVVTANHVTPVQFKAALASHRGELLAASNPLVKVLRFEQDFESRGTLFRIQEIADAYRSEIGFLVGTSFVVASLDSYGNKFLKAEEILGNFVRSVQSIDRSAGPQPGFCLGPVLVAGNPQLETARVLFRSESLKGTAFGVTTDTYRPSGEKTLLNRMSGPDSLMTVFEAGQTELRARELKLGELHAQEWLGFIKTKPNQGGKKYIFALETIRDRPAKTAPHLHVEFETGHAIGEGKYAPLTLNNEEAMAMWDAVVGSITFPGR